MKTVWAILEDVLQYIWAALLTYASTPEGLAKLAEIESDLAALGQSSAPVAVPTASKRGA